MVVIDFLHKFLRTKSGLPKTVTEIAYNFVDALKRYSYDADCELFHKVLFGELCEGVCAHCVGAERRAGFRFLLFWRGYGALIIRFRVFLLTRVFASKTRTYNASSIASKRRFHDQMLMCSGLIAAAEAEDMQQHGGRKSGSLARGLYTQLLKKHFPTKGDQDMKALVRALSYDQPLPSIFVRSPNLVP